VLLALAAPSLAHAATPPPNDDRAAAQSIPTFPGSVSGTTADATVERLDPQVSQCGRIESTVWYSITQSPDGTIVLDAQADGFAPVIRVYRMRPNGITEVDCASANAGQKAQIAFESVRGAGFLVVVGKKPSTPDAAFTLNAQLFLPPANDTVREAQPIRSLPATAKGTTLGATTDESDPGSCSLQGGTVWYAVAPGRAGRLVFQLHAEGNLDASIVVLEKVRSQIDEVDCARTDKKGDATAAASVEKGAQYLVVVGQRKGSSPGDFTLDVLASQAPEQAPGQRLAARGASSTVNGLTDVNDVWWTSMRPGTTYRIAFDSPGCAEVYLSHRSRRLTSLECRSYTTFTPGPDGGGRYVFEVVATGTTRSQPYRLQVAAAGNDDLGEGLPLANQSTARGSLSPSGVDLLDLYHFDVTQSSDVRLRLGGGFSLLLVTESGGRVASGGNEIRRRLGAGRYVVAVRGTTGQRAGRYAVSLVIRQLTSTTLTVTGDSFTARTSPTADGGTIELQIDRFDPLTGWQFNRLVRLSGRGGTYSWTPPAAGRWRARASFRGTLGYSPSRSGYVFVRTG
jgi:hypothetical protein